jgi:hypothetical protein
MQSSTIWYITPTWSNEQTQFIVHTSQRQADSRMPLLSHYLQRRTDLQHLTRMRCVFIPPSYIISSGEQTLKSFKSITYKQGMPIDYP